MKRLPHKGLSTLLQHVQRSALTDTEKSEALTGALPAVFRDEYGEACEDLREDLTRLADAMEAVTKPGSLAPLETVEDYYATLRADFERLERYHAELLRRLGE